MRETIVEMRKTNGSWHGRYIGPTVNGPSQTVDAVMHIGQSGDVSTAIGWLGQETRRSYSSMAAATMDTRNQLGKIIGVEMVRVRLVFAVDPGSYAVDTSQEAADAIKERAPQIRQRVYEYIHSQGVRGATADEAQQALGLSHQTCAPRVTELAKIGRIVRSDERRKTRYGRNAGVYLSGVFNAEAVALAQDAKEDEPRQLSLDGKQLPLINFGGSDDNE